MRMLALKLDCLCRENILFERSFQAAKYEEVVHACALADDVAALPDGHDTFVGSRGVMLSGGQQARLALARALYQVQGGRRGGWELWGMRQELMSESRFKC